MALSSLFQGAETAPKLDFLLDFLEHDEFRHNGHKLNDFCLWPSCIFEKMAKKNCTVSPKGRLY